MASAEHWWAGVIAALLSCVLSSAGYIMQRKAKLLKDEAMADGSKRHRAMLAFGIAVYILAALPDVLAYAWAPELVCATFGCFRLVVLTYMAHAFLKERIGCREAFGACTCTGGTLCLALGLMPEKDRGAPSAVDPGQFWAYNGICLVLLVVLVTGEHLPAASGWCRRHRLSYVCLPLATGLAYSLEKVFNTQIGQLTAPAGLADLLQKPSWLLCATAIACLGVTDFCLNLRGAQRLPVQIFVPLTFALTSTLQFVQSVLLFDELAHLDAAKASLAVCGAVASLAGALIIQLSRPDSWTQKASVDLIDDADGRQSRLHIVV